jgi:hypothetical protein
MGDPAVFAAVGDHPHVHLTTGGDPITGYLLDGTAVWTAPGP